MSEKLRHANIVMIRERTHAVFDLLVEQRWMTSYEAYEWLSGVMNLPRKEAHIGRMNPEQCEKVFHLAKAKLWDFVRRLRGAKENLEGRLLNLEKKSSVNPAPVVE